MLSLNPKHIWLMIYWHFFFSCDSLLMCWWLAIIKSLKNEIRHDADFVVTGGSVVCHNLLATLDNNVGVITTQFSMRMNRRPYIISDKICTLFVVIYYVVALDVPSVFNEFMRFSNPYPWYSRSLLNQTKTTSELVHIYLHVCHVMSIRHRELTRITIVLFLLLFSSLHIPVVRPEWNKNVKLSNMKMLNMICDLWFVWVRCLVKSYIFHKLDTHTIIYGCCSFSVCNLTQSIRQIFYVDILLMITFESRRGSFFSYLIALITLLCNIVSETIIMSW